MCDVRNFFLRIAELSGSTVITCDKDGGAENGALRSREDIQREILSLL
jgi:hypothetical protein